jgi:hypothetical protein
MSEKASNAVVTGLIVCLCLAGLVVAFLAMLPDRTYSPRASAVLPLELGAGELIHDYRANEVGADMAYKGRLIAVSGTVSGIGRDILGRPYVTLTSDGSDTIPSVQCSFRFKR